MDGIRLLFTPFSIPTNAKPIDTRGEASSLEEYRGVYSAKLTLLKEGYEKIKICGWGKKFKIKSYDNIFVIVLPSLEKKN